MYHISANSQGVREPTLGADDMAKTLMMWQRLARYKKSKRYLVDIQANKAKPKFQSCQKGMGNEYLRGKWLSRVIKWKQVKLN